jgi:Ca2+-transporting ATPase
MGPTCSIIYENEPIEKNAMLQKPRPFSTTFFNWKELATSIIQGVAITIGTLTVYQYAVSKAADEQVTRTMVFTSLISANVLLTLVNRSFYYSLFTTIKYKNNLVLLVVGLTIFISSSLIYIRPLAVFFGFNPLNVSDLLISVIIGFTSVIWFELYKAWLRKGSDVKTS